MSGALKFVGKVAGLVSTVASFIPGGETIAAIAAAVAVVATTAGNLLAKKPAAVGQVERRMFGANSPMIYAVGRSSSAGAQVHDVAWGGKVGKVYNPYRMLVILLSCAGPIHAIEAVQFDHATVPFSGSAATGYYGGFVWKDEQLGQQPETAALEAAPGQGWGTPPGWGSDYKLSGKAAIALSFKFDKEGKVFAQGLPPITVIRQGVSTYDARQDSTYPGGSGAHRIDDETTWEYSESPAQHAVAYALGRRENGKLVFGPGLEASGIDLNAAVAWDNVCDANGWTVGGDLYEPGDSWNNLKRLCQAGACEPVIGTDGVLTFDYLAPRVSLATVRARDIKGDVAESASGQTWRERVNTIVPRYRSEANQWNYVQATEQSVEDFVTADGEEKTEEIQYDLVQSADQAAELAQYELWQRREPPANIVLGPEWRAYQPGDTLTLDADIGLWPTDLDVVIRGKSYDPLTGLTSFELKGENPDKHAAVLGSTASPPPAPVIPTGEDLDIAFAENVAPVGYLETVIKASEILNIAGGDLITSVDAGSDASIVIADHERRYTGQSAPVAIDGATITGLAYDTPYWIYYDDPDRTGGAVTYGAVTGGASGAVTTADDPGRHFIGYVLSASSGGGDIVGDPGGLPIGIRPDNWNYV